MILGLRDGQIIADKENGPWGKKANSSRGWLAEIGAASGRRREASGRFTPFHAAHDVDASRRPVHVRL